MSKEIKKILDKYKVEIDADDYGGSSMDVISDSISDAQKTYEGLAFGELEKELDDHIRLKQGEAQLIGFFQSDQNDTQNDTLDELITAMGLTVEEYWKLRKDNSVMIMQLEARHGMIEDIINRRK